MAFSDIVATDKTAVLGGVWTGLFSPLAFWHEAHQFSSAAWSNASFLLVALVLIGPAYFLVVGAER